MILALDIGGSRIKAATWDGARLETLGETATPLQNRQAFAAAIRSYADAQAAKRISIAIAGVVDPLTGIGKVANIPAIDGLALGSMLEDATGLPVLVLNDADCFALAEARQGAGRGHGSVFGVILGSGVGGGLVVGGRVVTGSGGYAGEWGHGPVIHGEFAFPCGCGQVGCVDTVGSARGIERLHQARTGADLQSKDILARWQAGEDTAVETIEIWRDLIAGPLAMVLNVVGAGVVPVGGGLSRALGLVEYLDDAVRARILRATSSALLVPAECGADAGLLGAAMAGEAKWG